MFHGIQGHLACLAVTCSSESGEERAEARQPGLCLPSFCSTDVSCCISVFYTFRGVTKSLENKIKAMNQFHAEIPTPTPCASAHTLTCKSGGHCPCESHTHTALQSLSLKVRTLTTDTSHVYRPQKLIFLDPIISQDPDLNPSSATRWLTNQTFRRPGLCVSLTPTSWKYISTFTFLSGNWYPASLEPLGQIHPWDQADDANSPFNPFVPLVLPEPRWRASPYTPPRP